jgi:hypothetical protein
MKTAAEHWTLRNWHKQLEPALRKRLNFTPRQMLMAMVW